jgi:hypothetical protein
MRWTPMLCAARCVALLVLTSLKASYAYSAAIIDHSVDVVVAHYDEDLAWVNDIVNRFSVRAFVYDKKLSNDARQSNPQVHCEGLFVHVHDD